MVKKINLYFYYFFLLLNGSIVFAQSEKCGTFINTQNLLRLKKIKTEHLSASREDMQKNILTPSGKFRIHYDTLGIHQPALVTATGTRIPFSFDQYIDSVKVVLDYVWQVEIESFGFNIPPSDNGNGGGNEYDVYIRALPKGLYGETHFEDQIPAENSNPVYTTYIDIDNDYDSTYRTIGIDGLKATCAHEFNHAIQLGGSGFWDGDQYFYELCAQSMEPTVYPSVKDYVGDIHDYYANINTMSLFDRQYVKYPEGTILGGYERAIWSIFLMKKYGTDIMKTLWSEMKQNRPIQSLNNTLHLFSTSLQREFSDFSFWNFQTAYRADSVHYFPDAKIFPSVKLSASIAAISSLQNIPFTAKSFTAQYIKINTTVDSAFFIISNTNYSDALNYSEQIFPYRISFSSSSTSGLPAISNSIFATFHADDYLNWSYRAIGNSGSLPCFPNPFNPNSASLLISLNGIQSNSFAMLNVFSAGSMDLIYSGSPNFRLFSGIQYAEWNGRDNNGKIVPSGIYVFVLSNGSMLNRGKFAVIR